MANVMIVHYESYRALSMRHNGFGYPHQAYSVASVDPEDGMSSRGNPNWGKPNIPVPFFLTEFEQQVEKLGLRPGEYQASPQLRSWCRRNANMHYVPEYLLKLWGIGVNENWGPAREYMLLSRKH